MRLFRLLMVTAPLIAAMSHGAAADVVTMDSFSVTGPAGNTLFTDPFNLTGTLSGNGASSGVSTTTIPSNPVNYNVTGSFTESGGTATLNTANGALQASSPPFDPLDQQVAASFAGGVTPSSSKIGATGVFYMSVPTTVGALYGVELVDLNSGHNGDVIAMRVVETASGPQIELVNVNHFSDTLTLVESAALDTGHDEIALSLSKAAGLNGTVTASYDYIDGGVAGTVTTFTDTTDTVSDGATIVTAAFNALAPVPEPGTLALFGSCIVALGWTLRRKRNSL